MMFTKPNVTVVSTSGDPKDDYICLMIVCTCCAKEYLIGTTKSGYVAWLEGALIQDAMPDVSRDMREMFISGTCPECWTDMYGSGTDPRDFS